MSWLSAEEFAHLVERALAGLPQQFLDLLDNVAIVVEEEPSPEDLALAGTDGEEELFGLYHGLSLPERGASYGNVLPDRIVLFRGPLLRHCQTRRELEEEIRATVIHEIGHYFGLDEEDLP
ncbi:MAG: metallopeptidase family protein [Thermoanaerobaculum sp.]|nr:metallopeptidase family protein [Thermoanaerobaculum sp.]MDW7967881.1 metallopeptidase family protein [Thermoanaerobaculum sp.]